MGDYCVVNNHDVLGECGILEGELVWSPQHSVQSVREMSQPAVRAARVAQTGSRMEPVRPRAVRGDMRTIAASQICVRGVIKLGEEGDSTSSSCLKSYTQLSPSSALSSLTRED